MLSREEGYALNAAVTIIHQYNCRQRVTSTD